MVDAEFRAVAEDAATGTSVRRIVAFGAEYDGWLEAAGDDLLDQNGSFAGGTRDDGPGSIGHEGRDRVGGRRRPEAVPVSARRGPPGPALES